ncbi:helix-turn-helix transcriptional regulator [Streptomyces sp. NBC_00365]|uniref:helix-turn-helix transcriptional regulator n=1 Tax=Streptomyces sp. NBC_00365 TaxID=2975726 RepID=UPI00224E9801|nr:helix-turn-helix transcriptional regulator [Streptomyces sp. NBC_00365]MCX5095890.1 helix-turn-helix transcriptional regulator [Streptomyces sp. NBC_00365]
MASQQSSSADMELGRFLHARRTQTSPDQVGLTVGAGLRRTPGLRREELATLAGISIDYYVRLERGRETRPSPSVLDALARALQLDEAEHQHMRDLAAQAARYAPEPSPPSRTMPPHLKLILEALRPNPAYAISRSMDLLAWNPGGLALYAGLADWPATQRNLARYVFLHPTARTLFHDDWDNQVRGCVARLRAVAGTDPDAPDLTDLVGELLLKSPDFAKLWERYEVVGRKNVQKTFHHPQVGTLTLSGQSLHIEGTPGQRLGVYTAEPGSPDHDAMLLLDATAPDAEVHSDAKAGQQRRAQP